MGPRNRQYFTKVLVWWCTTALVMSSSISGQKELGNYDDGGGDGGGGGMEVRSDPGEEAGASSLCPPSCFCESEAGYATCVGDGLWAPPHLPPGLIRVELRGFLVPEVSAVQLHHLPGLHELQLNQCNLTTLCDDAFAQLPDLDQLDMSENQLVTLGPGSFRGLTSLKHLDLSANRLSNLTHPFTHLPSLQHLNLRDNLLISLTQDTFQGLDRVQYVNLDGNRISSVEVAAFQHLTSLAHLILSNNPLSSLATLDFFGSRLQYIDVSNIGIVRVPQALTQFVRDLRLAKNAIAEIHRGDLDSYPYLGLLVLDDNGLEVLEEDALGRHEYLARLWLNGNKLKNVPLSLPPALTALYIEENLISVLREGDFRGLSSLEQLFLQRNHITTIAPCTLCELVSLKALDLQANRLTNLTSRIFSRLASLETLDLSQNPLLSLSADIFTGLTSVRVLQMSRVHSRKVDMPDTLFDPLKGLQILEMYGSPNIVSRLVNTTRMLHSLRGIRELNIMHNDLTALRTDFPDFFPKLQVAKLSGNTWNCSSPSTVMWMKRWMTHSPVHFYRSYSIRCSIPSFLGYKPVMLLEESDFPSPTSPTTTTATITTTTTTTTTTIAFASVLPATATSTTTATLSPPLHSPEIDNVIVEISAANSGDDPLLNASVIGSGNQEISIDDANGFWNYSDASSSFISSSSSSSSSSSKGRTFNHDSRKRDFVRTYYNTSLVYGIIPFHPPESSPPSETAPEAGADGEAPAAAATEISSVSGTSPHEFLEVNSSNAPNTINAVANESVQISKNPTTSTVPLPGTDTTNETLVLLTIPTKQVLVTDSKPKAVPTTSDIATNVGSNQTSVRNWILYNRMPPKAKDFSPKNTKGKGLKSKGKSNKKENRGKRKRKLGKKVKSLRVITPDVKQRSPHTRESSSKNDDEQSSFVTQNKDLWIYRGDSSHGLSQSQPLPIGMGHGRVSDGAVVGAAIVASCVGIALLVGGLMLARGRGKGSGAIWESSSYWRDGDNEDVVMAVGVGQTGTGIVTESEGTVGVITETHRGLNNRLYLLLQRDTTTGITPESLPDPRAPSPAPKWH